MSAMIRTVCEAALMIQRKQCYGNFELLSLLVKFMRSCGRTDRKNAFSLSVFQENGFGSFQYF